MISLTIVTNYTTKQSTNKITMMNKEEIKDSHQEG